MQHPASFRSSTLTLDGALEQHIGQFGHGQVRHVAGAVEEKVAGSAMWHAPLQTTFIDTDNLSPP
jgi:hypothetical protein